MLRPIIMIGCGGSGQKAVRYVRDAVRRRLIHAGWEDGVPRAWQFIGIDTLTDQEDASIPFLPNNDYVSVSLQFNNYQDLNAALEAKFGLRGQQPEAFNDLIGWRPNPRQVNVPLKDGAAQLRAVGRSAGVLALQDNVRDRIVHAFGQCAAGGPELVEISKRLGVDVPPGTPTPAPMVLVVGSMAGGTGAGIMLDVVDLVRRSHIDGAFPVMVAFTPDIFGSVQTDMMTANSAAFMSEMLSAYWDDEATDSALIPANVAVNTRGPHSVFVIGRRNIDGLDLADSKNVYRAVGEALAAVTTSSQVQQSFHNFITVNWAMAAPANAGGYGFKNHDSSMKGVASSFGSSTISIGRDRFRDYMQKLLHRSVIEHLVVGFEAAAVANFGETEAKSMAMPAKVAELARRNSDKFMVDCGLTLQQIGDAFVSNNVMKAQLGEVSNLIKAPFQAAQQQTGQVWLNTIIAQAQQSKVSSKQKADAEVNDRLQKWSSEVYRSVLRTTTEFSASLSIPVVLSLIEIARAEAMKTASELREKAKNDRTDAANAEAKARTHLANQKGSISLSSAPVQETVNDISKSIVWEWSAGVREKLAATLESAASSMLASIEGGLRQANGRINAMMTPQDGKAPIIATWPRNTNEVPASFAPSPVEFYLEDYSTWPQRAKELINRSLGNRQGLPIDPVEAARTLIIRGGFGGTGTGQAVNPLIWGEGHGSEPEWEAGHVVSIKVDDSIEGLGERIDAWLTRPATDLSRVLAEGLGTYLDTTDPLTKAPVADHHQRLTAFRTQLQLALKQSRPLVEINQAMNAIVHPNKLSYSLNIQGFPFGVGHPAREVTEEIIQGFLSTAESVDWAFTAAEAESVLISNFLEYPVSPSVLMSFTQPFASALNNFNEGLLQGAFWQWRRARILENFVPLPDTLRVAAIRGFAVARALGVMSLETRSQNVIADRDGDKLFPKWLLTPADGNNLLPALLEAMVLTFAEASTKGDKAFEAYGSLIEYGTGASVVGEFSVGGVLKHFLENGDYDGVRVVDSNRAEAVSGFDIATRAAAVIEYLQGNIDRFEDLERTKPDAQSWRNQTGTVEPVDTLTRELLRDMKTAYIEVREAVRKATQQKKTVA